MCMSQKHAHSAPAANTTRCLCFYNNYFYRITFLPFHFSLPSLQNQRKTSLGFENMAWCQAKICQFWFKRLFWRFKIMLTGSFMASKTSHTVQLRAVGLLWGFALWGAGMVQTLNTDLKLHHKETTDLPRVQWSLLTAWWKIKEYWTPNVTILNWKLPKMLWILFFWAISCTLGPYFPSLVPL